MFSTYFVYKIIDKSKVIVYNKRKGRIKKEAYIMLPKFNNVSFEEFLRIDKYSEEYSNKVIPDITVICDKSGLVFTRPVSPCKQGELAIPHEARRVVTWEK